MNLNPLFALLLCIHAGSAHALGGLAELTVFDRSDGRPLPVYWHAGRAWVVGKPGNEYQLTVRSRQGEELLAVMSVDGVNVVSGETASSQQSGYVLAPGRPVEVKGWRKNLDRTAAFYFTALPDSYAARTGRPDNVGSIGVALFRKKRPEPPMEVAPLSRQAPEATSRDQSAPAAATAESAGSRSQTKSRSAEDRLGTGHGRNESSPAYYASFERASTQPAETVVLYYDSYRNLVARGVIPRSPAAPQFPNPYPNPFPGFVPDPPA